MKEVLNAIATATLANTNYTLLLAGRDNEDIIVDRVFVSNESGGAGTVSVARVPDGATAAIAHNVAITASIANDAAGAVTTPIIITSGQNLYVKASAADMTVSCDYRVAGE